jgi:hypothetical protein
VAAGLWALPTRVSVPLADGEVLPGMGHLFMNLEIPLGDLEKVPHAAQGAKEGWKWNS